MPQMSPLFWNFMMLFSFLCILFNLTKIYFSFNNKFLSLSMNNKLDNFKTNKWTW